MPLISLFTPTHDTRWLIELYSSLVTQDHADWEWVILLNGDAEFSSEDPRVKVFKDVSGIHRVGHLKFTACKHCTGDVLLEMDHDDMLMPGALREVAQVFEDPRIDFVYSNTVNHDVRSGEPLTWSPYYGWQMRDVEFQGLQCKEAVSSPPYPQAISRIWYAPNHLRAWRASFYWRVGGHDSSMKVCDDQDLICRTYINGQMFHIDKPLYFYRVHGENTWLKNQQEIHAEMWRVHDRHIKDMAVRWSTYYRLRCLDLCGGINAVKGLESVDLHDADVIADLDQPWPFEDNSVGLIRANDAIEHLKNPIHTMNEAWRVLAHGGFFLIAVPSSEGVGAHCDPTHVSFWNWRSFRYYTEAQMQQYIRHAGASCRFQKIKVETVTCYDGVPYVMAHLVAIKQDAPRFYGELLI